MHLLPGHQGVASSARGGRGAMKLDEVVGQFLLDLEVKGRTKATLIDYRHRLSILVGLLQELCRVSEVEQVKVIHLRQVVQHLLTAKPVYRRGRKCDSDAMAPVTVRA